MIWSPLRVAANQAISLPSCQVEEKKSRYPLRTKSLCHAKIVRDVSALRVLQSKRSSIDSWYTPLVYPSSRLLVPEFACIRTRCLS